MFYRLPQARCFTDIGNLSLDFEYRPTFFQKIFRRRNYERQGACFHPGRSTRNRGVHKTDLLFGAFLSHPFKVFSVDRGHIDDPGIFMAAFKDAVGTGHHLDHLLIV